MLEKLEVTNLSILGSIEVNFSNGLNIATGETGAGKSLMLSTLVFFPAKKFPLELIKNKDDETVISVLVRLKSKNMKKIFLENNLKIECNDLFKIVRKISSNKITKYYINNVKVKADIVTQIFENYFSDYSRAVLLQNQRKRALGYGDSVVQIQNKIDLSEYY